jgi:hypothetical protein
LQSPDPLKTVVDFYKTHFTGFKIEQSFLNATAGYLRMSNGQYQVTLSAGRCCGDGAAGVQGGGDGVHGSGGRATRPTVTTFTVNVENK